MATVVLAVPALELSVDLAMSLDEAGHRVVRIASAAELEKVTIADVLVVDVGMALPEFQAMHAWAASRAVSVVSMAIMAEHDPVGRVLDAVEASLARGSRPPMESFPDQVVIDVAYTSGPTTDPAPPPSFRDPDELYRKIERALRR